MDLEPLATYPARGAANIAELAGYSGFRLELGAKTHTSDPTPAGVPTHTVALTAGGSAVGTLHLYGAAHEDGPWLADWAGRVFAKCARSEARLGGPSAPRSYEDVQAMLAATPLTPRERDVVGRLLSGASTRQIASSTGLTVATVNTYLKRIFAKLGVHSRVELVARVTGTRGLVPSGPSPETDAPRS